MLSAPPVLHASLFDGEGADTALARFMLELRSKGITDPAVLNAFEAAPRALFLPHVRPGLLYAPIFLPLPCGEEAEDPFTLARHVMLLGARKGMRVLEIGTGSGFLTAVLARSGARLVSIERYATLLKAAERALKHLGLVDVEFVQADALARGAISGGFDRIIVNGAMSMVPHGLIEALAPGGIALGHRLRDNDTRLTLWRKDASGLLQESDIGTSRACVLRAGLPRKL